MLIEKITDEKAVESSAIMWVYFSIIYDAPYQYVFFSIFLTHGFEFWNMVWDDFKIHFNCDKIGVP